MTFLDDLALAHQQHEGYFIGSRSWRNKNPGNLRAGAPTDANGFTIYPNYTAGFLALKLDVKAKICGYSRHIDYSKNPTFLTYVKVYAPSDDGNDPGGYCQSLCRALNQYDVRPDTPLTVMCQLVNGVIDKVPGEPQPLVLPSYGVQLAQVVKAIGRYAGKTLTALQAMRLRMLGRKKDRLEEDIQEQK